MVNLSIIIPTINAAKRLHPTLASIAQLGETSLVWELIIVDGGSEDGIREVAKTIGAEFIESKLGRGEQLKTGAAIAKGEWLLFLHADTVLATGWCAEVEASFEILESTGRAGYFRFALADKCWQAQLLEHLVFWRSYFFGLPYGDQGLLLSRKLYQDLGGYQDFPLMEDVDIVRRLGRSRLHPFNSVAMTSAERYKRDGYWLRQSRNFLCLCLYFLQVPKSVIQRLYER